MSNSPAYLMYPGDILSSGRVAALKPLEELWYRRAMDLGWEHLGMPSDPKEFAGWVGRGCTTAAAEKIIKIFYVPKKKDPLKVVNPRQEKERKAYNDKRKATSEARRLAARARWDKKKKDVDANADANAMQKSNTNSQEKTRISVNADNKGILPHANAMQNDAIPIPIPNKEESKEGEHTQTHARRPSANDFGKPASETELEALTEKHGFPIAELHKAFPKLRLSKKQQNLLFTSVKPRDAEAWARTLRIYQGNHDPTRGAYLPEKVGNLLSVFEAEKKKLEKDANGTNSKYPQRRSNVTVLEESEQYFRDKLRAEEADNRGGARDIHPDQQDPGPARMDAIDSKRA